MKITTLIHNIYVSLAETTITTTKIHMYNILRSMDIGNGLSSVFARSDN